MYQLTKKLVFHSLKRKNNCKYPSILKIKEFLYQSYLRNSDELEWPFK